MIKACELNETGYETENGHRGDHRENGQETIAEMGFDERKIAPCQHNGTSIWGRGHSKGKGFRGENELRVFENRSLSCWGSVVEGESRWSGPQGPAGARVVIRGLQPKQEQHLICI